MSLNIPNSSPTVSSVLPIWSAASGSLPRPIAGSAGGSIRRSPGRSSKPWRRVRRWRAAGCGTDRGIAMIYSSDRILTTHAGSLPRQPELREPGLEGKRLTLRPGKFDRELRAAVAEVVQRHVAGGADIVNDGDLSKTN